MFARAYTPPCAKLLVLVAQLNTKIDKNFIISYIICIFMYAGKKEFTPKLFYSLNLDKFVNH
jgi:hypothetical protein